MDSTTSAQEASGRPLSLALNDYENFKRRNMKIDLTRGKPSADQLDLSNPLLTLPGDTGYLQADGADARNYYGGPAGVPEARNLFSKTMGVVPERLIVANNSSLALMHDALVFCLLKGSTEGLGPWVGQRGVKFICPSPGYDRHFALCEQYGIEMLPVSLTGTGPDMDQVEDLVADPMVKGIWCVPKYSNPTGEVYSSDVINRLAQMTTGASDFRIFWDNAYVHHHLTEDQVEIDNISDLCDRAGHENRPFVFGSTSKITFPGAGLGLFASSLENINWFLSLASKRTIGPDKLNQLRHVKFLENHEGLLRHMDKHRALLAPRFDVVEKALSARLTGSGLAKWVRPSGGYFVCVEIKSASAKRVVELAQEAGVALVPAGATHPYNDDPSDSFIRIAPTYPDVDQLKIGVEIIAASIVVASDEAVQNNSNSR